MDKKCSMFYYYAAVSSSQDYYSTLAAFAYSVITD